MLKKAMRFRIFNPLKYLEIEKYHLTVKPGIECIIIMYSLITLLKHNLQLLEHLRSSLVFLGVLVAYSLVFYVVSCVLLFVCLSFFIFSCVSLFSIYEFDCPSGTLRPSFIPIRGPKAWQLHVITTV